jgi:hypothetical protein
MDMTLFWVLAVIVAVTLVGIRLARRAVAVRPAPRRYLPPGKRFRESLEDMRLRSGANPEDLSAQTEAARETGAPPPDLTGLPQTPEDVRRQRERDD